MAAMGQHLPDLGQAADAHRRGRSCGRPAAWGRVGGQHLPDRGPAADAHRRCRSCGRPDAGFWPAADAHRRGRSQAGAIVWASGTLTGGAYRVGVRVPGDMGSGRHLPDRGQAAHAHRRCRAGCRSSLWDTVSHKLFGGSDQQGRNPVASSLPDRGHSATPTGGADRVGVRMQDRGGYVVPFPRRDAGATGHSPCLIAAERLTLTGGADRVGVRMPGNAGGNASTCRIVASLRSQAVPIVWASGCLGTWAAASTLPDRGQAADAHRRGRLCGRPDAGSRPSG